MSIISLWKNNKSDFTSKSIDQIQGFIGQLLDGSHESGEFREFISSIPTSLLQAYALQCLSIKFNDSGLVLQDIVNEIGRRLGYHVTFGRYRGSAQYDGFDGLWKIPGGESVVVEIKTTTAYSINLDTIVKYRTNLINKNEIEHDKSSILIVVGRIDTSGWEAQIRGSKYAWDIRLVSIDALIKLLHIKESIDDTTVFDKIRTVLQPHEYTLLDEIVDLVFSTAEDIGVDDNPPIKEKPIIKGQEKKSSPVDFYSECISKLESTLALDLIKESRGRYTSPNGEVVIQLSISKEHKEPNTNYWFALHPHQLERLKKAKEGYVAWGCGSEKLIFVVPVKETEKWLPNLHTTDREDGRFYWHIIIKPQDQSWILTTRKDSSNIDLSSFKI